MSGTASRTWTATATSISSPSSGSATSSTIGTTGSAAAYRFVLAADTLKDVDGTPIFSDRQNIPQLGDLDCNGRSDLLIGRLDGTVARYETAALDPHGTPAFRLVAKEFEGIRIIGQQGGPALPVGPSMHGANTMALADHDGDRDLDLFWGDFFEPGLLLIANSGTCPAPNFRTSRCSSPSAARCSPRATMRRPSAT